MTKYSEYKSRRINRFIRDTCDELIKCAENVHNRINRELKDSPYTVEMLLRNYISGVSLATPVGGGIHHRDFIIIFEFVDKKDKNVFLFARIPLKIIGPKEVLSPHCCINNEDDIYDYVMSELKEHRNKDYFTLNEILDLTNKKILYSEAYPNYYFKKLCDNIRSSFNIEDEYLEECIIEIYEKIKKSSKKNESLLFNMDSYASLESWAIAKAKEIHIDDLNNFRLYSRFRLTSTIHDYSLKILLNLLLSYYLQEYQPALANEALTFKTYYEENNLLICNNIVEVSDIQCNFTTNGCYQDINIKKFTKSL